MINLKISRTTLSLLLLSTFCIFFQIGRILLRNDADFSFLIWNLFLAWMPLFFALLARRVTYKIGKISLLMAWLLFFPNAPYIITDLLHLNGYSQNILWFDSLLIFIFALTGLLLGLYSLHIAHQIFEQLFGKIKAWFLIFGSLAISGFGVYLGRFSRWNSWDLVRHPFGLLNDIFHQVHNPVAIQLSFIFATTMLFFYATFCIFISSKNHEFTENIS